jgi:hypothetical protein
VVELEDRRQLWLYEGELHPSEGFLAVAGRVPEQWHEGMVRFDEMRPGCWDIHARIRDMDINGVYASLCFPSDLAGFAGRIFARSRDPEYGLACMRAWNDWHVEVWAGTYPDRIIPLQLTWLNDPQVAAEEIRRNAARGVRAVSFPNRPDAPTRWGCRRSTPTTGTRSCGPARRPTPSSACTPGPRPGSR